MLRELWKASDGTDPDDPESWRSSTDTPLVWAWFVLYGIVPFVLFVFSIGSFLDGGLCQRREASNHWPRASTTSARSVRLGDGQRRRRGRLDPVRQGLTARHKQLTSER